MNALEIIASRVEDARRAGIKRREMEVRERDARGRVTRGIDPDQLRTASGIFPGSGLMSRQMADVLNDPSNPERNGMVYYLALGMYGIIGSDKEVWSRVAGRMYLAGTRTYDPAVPVSLDLAGFPPSLTAEDLGVDEGTRERLYTFLRQVLLPGIVEFNKKYSPDILVSSINFRAFSLNLVRVLSELQRVSESGNRT